LGDGIPASSLAKDRLGDPDCMGCGYNRAQSVASTAKWGPGQLERHAKYRHPNEYASMQDYDQGARQTILTGQRFTYTDRQTGLPRVGYYDRSTNRFTGLTVDETRITTHFRPTSGEGYVTGLRDSTYRP